MTSSSEESDLDPEDFWDDIQNIGPSDPTSPIKISPDFKRTITMSVSSPTKFLFQQLTSFSEEFFKQRMEQSLQKLRHENAEQVKSVKIDVRNRTRKELKSAVDEIRAQFEKEVFMIRQDHDRMKEEISKRNKEIMLIAEYMIDQEAMIAQNRVQSTFKPKEVEKLDETIAEEKQLKKDLNMTRVQIDAMKEAIKDYSSETTQSAAKVRELDNEIALIQKRHREELKELGVYLENRVEKAREMRDQARKEFEDFKKLGWNELEDKEESCTKQREVIGALQNELKKAKGILQNPRLKLRVHERLKDYLDEYELESHESISMMHRTMNGGSRRSRTNEKRNICTTRSNFENSVRYGNMLEPPSEPAKYLTTKIGFVANHRSRLSEGGGIL